MPPDPRANPDLFGHAAAVDTFAGALEAGRPHHAWLITGPPGIGKATLAFRLARMLLVRGSLGIDDPAARRIIAGSHADLLTLERTINPRTKKLSQDITIDQVRGVAGFLHLTPAEGGWRIVLIDGAEAMNRNAANALLKVLEEPPNRAMLLLTASAPGRLLPTVRSRCRRLPLSPLNPAEMREALAVLLPDQVAEPLIQAARGSPGRAVELAEEHTLALDQLAREVVAAPPREVGRMHGIAAEVVKQDTGFSAFMTMLRDHVADRTRAAGRAGQGVRPLANDVDLWHALTRLQDETERFNLDKRTAVIAGLELLSAQ